jgi:hypothetical protein
LEHIIVYEAHHGHSLTGKEVIHHIDGNKLNNSPENLLLCKDNSSHLKEHHSNSK